MLLEKSKIKKFDQLQKVVAISEMINSVQHRLDNRLEFCENVYGRDTGGHILGSDCDLKYLEKNIAIRERLKRYYNNELTKIKKLTIK